MKIILTFMFIITLSLDLFGRMNPFEPTDTFNEKKSEYYKIEQQKREKLLQEQQLANKISQEKEQKKIALAKSKQIQNESYDILPFVKIKVINNMLTIIVDKKYKLINEDILQSEKKLLFDFRGTVSFYTIRKNIKHKDFHSFAVGTHMKQNYFRVVINLEDNIKQYKENIHSEKGIITIHKLNK